MDRVGTGLHSEVQLRVKSDSLMTWPRALAWRWSIAM
jgi:hypothetical protein